ncbi:TNT domain-containing protein [Klebsiella electrica]
MRARRYQPGGRHRGGRQCRHPGRTRRQGTPYEQRALAPGAKAEKYYEYEVIKPLPAIQGRIAPAFGEPGGGIQILPNMQDRVNVEWLLKNEYIREVR